MWFIIGVLGFMIAGSVVMYKVMNMDENFSRFENDKYNYSQKKSYPVVIYHNRKPEDAHSELPEQVDEKV